MPVQSQLSIRDAVGGALRFVREDWQFVLAVAGCAALAQGLVLALGPSLIWMVALIVVLITAHTALASGALGLPRPFFDRLPGDSARVAAAMTMIGFFLGIIFLMLTFVAMSILISPYETQVKAAGENQAALQAIIQRAIEGRPEVITIIMAVGAAIVFGLTTRFYLAAPATIDRRRVTVFESWKMTRGNFLRIAGARLLLLTPAFIFASALQSLVSIALQTPVNDPVVMLQYASGNPLGFAGFYTLGLFLQIAIFSALEAALSARLYRALSASPVR